MQKVCDMLVTIWKFSQSNENVSNSTFDHLVKIENGIKVRPVLKKFKIPLFFKLNYYVL